MDYQEIIETQETKLAWLQELTCLFPFTSFFPLHIINIQQKKSETSAHKKGNDDKHQKTNIHF